MLVCLYTFLNRAFLGIYFTHLSPGYGCSKLNCSEPDICELQECSEHATCSGDEDPHECSCNPGFSGDGLVCDNINECNDGSHSCSTHTTCTDNLGSYSCICKEWFSGDGRSCIFAGCPAGNFATDSNTCGECPINTYNNIKQSLVRKCIPCPNYYTTETTGSTSITQCKCKYFLGS